METPTVQEESHTYKIQHEHLIWQETTLHAASDGSVDPVSGRAAFVWILAMTNNTGFIKKSNPVLANPRTMTSYRSELAGLHDLMQYIDANDYTQHITVWSDSKSSLAKISQHEDTVINDLTNLERDLISAIF